MKRPGRILIVFVAIAFYWSYPYRHLRFSQRTDLPVIQRPLDRPGDGWYMPPLPIMLATDTFSYLRQRSHDPLSGHARPAWGIFGLVTLWACLNICGRTSWTSRATLSVLDMITPFVLLVPLLLFGLIGNSHSESVDDSGRPGDSNEER